MTGQITLYAGATAPTGFLICDGSTFDATTYPALNTLLGSNVLPDLRDRFPLGASGTNVLLSIGGNDSHALSIGEMPSHSHDLNTKNANSNQKIAAGHVIGNVQGTNTNIFSNAAPDTIMSSSSIAATGNGDAFSIVNPFVALNFIIDAV